MKIVEKVKDKGGDGFETLRVKSDLKVRILKIQNDHYAATSRKVSVTELLREALDARAKLLGSKSKHA